MNSSTSPVLQPVSSAHSQPWVEPGVTLPARQRDRQQVVLHHLSHQALSGIALEQLFALTAQAIAQVMPHTTVSVWKLLSDGCTFQEVTQTSPHQSLRTISTRTDPQLALVFNRSRSLIITPHQNPELLVCCTAETQYSRHYPISIPGQTLGLLSVCSPEPEPFAQTEHLFLQSVTHLLATAIERQRSAALLKVQTQILEAVAAGADLYQILESLCLLLEAQTPGALCSILLVDSQQNCLRAGAAPNIPPEFAAGVDGLFIREGGGSCGTAACRGEAVFVADIATDPLWRDYRDFALSHNIRACWSKPFLSQTGEVLGTFALSHQVSCEPTAYHLQILDTATHLVSIAVENHRNTSQLQHQALYDPLTGLPNRVLFVQQLEQQCQQSDSDGCALLFLDVDHFKLVNDSLGHTVGDQLLVAFADRLQGCMRTGDCFARLSGDEFAMLLKGIATTQQAQAVGHCIQRNLEQPLVLAGQEVFVSVSIGIVQVNDQGQQPAELLRDADTAMYQAKAQERGSIVVFSPQMHTQAHQRLQLAHDLRQALDQMAQGQSAPFMLHYQPIVQLATGAIAGFEALIRWQHPDQGWISPDQFIPVAEETGLIVPLGRWVLHQACAQWRQWQADGAGHKLGMMSVNVSSRQFIQLDFLDLIRQVLTETGIPPHYLKLEITETMLMETSRYITQMLTELRALGVRLSLDDFGTGYSSLSYLHEFPVQTLKIDRSFVSRLSTAHNPIVHSMIALAGGLGMDAIAEGIETREQLQVLRQLGCEYGQGYYFSRPVAATEALTLLMGS
ncbi:MAG: EAL domain-containing protein [Spirulina sp. SIO3F2]|nr:EAL domain-containing protein [Spirulina sp. SIO3F2]